MQYDTEMNLVLWTDTEANCRGQVRTTYIPAKHVHIIRTNLLKGINWNLASPVYPITREKAAFIYTHEQYGSH